jgi:hypothetical protein
MISYELLGEYVSANMIHQRYFFVLNIVIYYPKLLLFLLNL